MLDWTFAWGPCKRSMGACRLQVPCKRCVSKHKPTVSPWFFLHVFCITAAIAKLKNLTSLGDGLQRPGTCNKKGTCNNVLSLGLPVYCNHGRCSIELSLEAPVNEAWAPSDCKCPARGVWSTQANSEPLICSARVLYNGCYRKAQKYNFLRGWPLKARYLQ